MRLHIYSLKKPEYHKEVESVNLKTISGELTIMDNHRPLIAPLKTGKITIVDKKGETDILESSGGFLEIRPGSQVSILVN